MIFSAKDAFTIVWEEINMTQFGDTAAPIQFFEGYTFWFSDLRAEMVKNYIVH